MYLVVAQARAQSQEAQHSSTPPNQSPNNASPNTRLMQMVQQVKEVLPQVPSPSIARDLSKLWVLLLNLSHVHKFLVIEICMGIYNGSPSACFCHFPNMFCALVPAKVDSLQVKIQ